MACRAVWTLAAHAEPAPGKGVRVTDSGRHERFERMVMPHLDAAYNLARWLTRDATDAEDVTQEAMVRALKYFDGFSAEEADSRPWLLSIVRNTCIDWLRHNRPAAVLADGQAVLDMLEWGGENPEQEASRHDQAAQVDRAVSQLPLDYREVIVLREFEDLSYKDIALVTGVPIGTVMSRLVRILMKSATDNAGKTTTGHGPVAAKISGK